MQKRKINLLRISIIVALWFWGILRNSTPVLAAVGSVPVDGNSYENTSNGTFDISENYKKTQLSYGKHSLGKLYINGDVSTKNNLDDTVSYPVNDNVSIYYLYDGSYHSNDENSWNLYSSDSKRVHNIDLQKKADNGAIVVQKSVDGETWETVKIICNAFEKKNTNKAVLWDTTYEEIKQGTYFRVIVAYTMRKLSNNEGGIDVMGDKLFSDKEYSYASFVETYTFHICNEKNYVLLRDIISGAAHSSGDSIMNGFYIDTQGSTDTITVKHGNKTYNDVKDYDRFTEKGKYTVEIANKHDKKRYYKVEIISGLSGVEISPSLYVGEINSGFQGKGVKGNSVFGMDSHTKLYVAQRYGSLPKQGKYNGYDSYGIEGKDARIFLRLKPFQQDNTNKWSVSSSEYGKEEGQLISGIKTGIVGKGAVIVQTSDTGNADDWKRVLCNIDMESSFSSDVDINLLSFGADLSKGLYVRVLYCYQAKNASNEQEYDFCEEYKFYLCPSSNEAIRFSNLSLSRESYEEMFGDADANSIALYKRGETLLNNSCTTTGFRINNDNNKTVSIEVLKDGKNIDLPQNMIFLEGGRYDIHMENRFGDIKDVTIYVDRDTNEDSLKRYFGSGFLRGKRIYEENEYPVYEAENVTFNIEEVTDNVVAIYGVITNNSTGKKTEIAPTRKKNNIKIFAPGEYTAVFKTAVDPELECGDVRVFEFKFKIIPKGTAPGPQNNKKQLYDVYAHSSMVDSYPVFYAVSYSSALGQMVTLAFEDRKDAVDYAVKYLAGVVKEQEDGSYLYKGDLISPGKVLVFNKDQKMDMTEALYEMAEQAVYEKCFDMSNVSTYMTLPDSIIEETPNLRTLELDREVTVYGAGQKELLTDVNELPIISDKPFAFCFKGIRKQIGKDNFMFVKDKYGCDSYNVTITDKNGKKYPIKYMKSVGTQLNEAGCPSGVITITERTFWGDETSYDALYIKSDEITTKVNLIYEADGEEKKLCVDESGLTKEIKTNYLKINGIEDEIDEYSFVRIEKDGNDVGFYVKGQSNDIIIDEPGKYHVVVLNRLGNGFSFDVEINSK